MDTLFEDAPTIEVFTETINEGVCSFEQCRAAVVWATVAKSGKHMIFSGRLSALKVVRHGTRDGAGTTFFEHSANHWKDCPGASEFKRKKAGV